MATTSRDRQDGSGEQGASRGGSAGGMGGGNGGMDQKLKDAYAQYSKSMQQANMANLAGPHGFNKAVDNYNNRSGWWDALDWIGGPFIDVNKPNPTIPGSYARGDWHTSTNPLGAVGALAGMGMGIPGLGFLGSQIGSAVGIPDIYHGGSGYVGDMANAYNGSTMNTAAGQTGGTGMAGQGSNNNGDFGLRYAGNRAVDPQRSGAPMAPTAPGAPGMPQPGMGLMSAPGKYLGIPGGKPYGLMAPGYSWVG